MRNSHTIYTSSNSSSDKHKEDVKVSYWLEKLFNQKKEQSDAHKVEMKKSSAEQVKKTINNSRSIADMTKNSNSILMSVSTVFPYDLFPTSINVEATRVSIITRQLFASQVHSIDIMDISSVFIETSILFATLTLMSKTFSQSKLTIGRLWIKEAIMIRRIIEGLRMFEKRDINITHFSREELLAKLKELSTTNIVL
jgi:hypothetical protein